MDIGMVAVVIFLCLHKCLFTMTCGVEWWQDSSLKVIRQVRRLATGCGEGARQRSTVV